jgi:putative peptidoglycan lipid II flippase
MKNNSTSVVNSTLIVMLSVVLSRFTGYFREMLIPNIAEFGSVTSAYQSAFLLPDFMFQLILGGAIAAAIVPFVSGFFKMKREKEGWSSLSSFINSIIILTIITCSLGIIFAPELLNIVVKGFVDKSIENLELTVRLTRILFPSVAFLMLAGICNGVLNGYQRFAFAAYGPVLYNVFVIISILIFANDNINDNNGIEKVALGVMISSILYFIIQVSATFKNMKFYRPKIKPRDDEFHKLVKIAIPALLASSIYQINFIVTNSFGSFGTEDTIQTIRTANTIWQMPLGIIAQGIGVVLLPAMAGEFALKNKDSFKNKFRSGFTAIYFLIVPSAVAVFILNREIINAFVAFTERVTKDNVDYVARVLALYSPALIGQAGVTFLNRTFYAMKNTKLPLLSGVISVGINISLCYFFSEYTNMGAEAMALAYSIAVLFNLSILLILFIKKQRGILDKSVSVSLCKTLICSLIMGFLIYLIQYLLPITTENNILQIVFLLLISLAGFVVYIIASLIIKNKSAIDIKYEVKKRIPFLK